MNITVTCYLVYLLTSVALLVLGAMHFFNMFNFQKMRGKGNAPATPERPLAPRPPLIPHL